jgi:hypothetical protein
MLKSVSDGTTYYNFRGSLLQATQHKHDTHLRSAVFARGVTFPWSSRSFRGHVRHPHRRQIFQKILEKSTGDPTAKIHSVHTKGSKEQPVQREHKTGNTALIGNFTEAGGDHQEAKKVMTLTQRTTDDT